MSKKIGIIIILLGAFLIIILLGILVVLEPAPPTDPSAKGPALLPPGEIGLSPQVYVPVEFKGPTSPPSAKGPAELPPGEIEISE